MEPLETADRCVRLSVLGIDLQAGYPPARSVNQQVVFWGFDPGRSLRYGFKVDLRPYLSFQQFELVFQVCDGAFIFLHPLPTAEFQVLCSQFFIPVVEIAQPVGDILDDDGRRGRPLTGFQDPFFDLLWGQQGDNLRLPGWVD
jgi:hypothetical protein